MKRFAAVISAFSMAAALAVFASAAESVPIAKLTPAQAAGSEAADGVNSVPMQPLTPAENAELPNIGIIGGADGPTQVYVTEAAPTEDMKELTKSVYPGKEDHKCKDHFAKGHDMIERLRVVRDALAAAETEEERAAAMAQLDELLNSWTATRQKTEPPKETVAPAEVQPSVNPDGSFNMESTLVF